MPTKHWFFQDTFALVIFSFLFKYQIIKASMSFVGLSVDKIQNRHSYFLSKAIRYASEARMRLISWIVDHPRGGDCPMDGDHSRRVKVLGTMTV